MYGGNEMLGERIRELRQAKGLNQVELGSRLNVSKQSISNYESNNILPSIDMLTKLANFFDVSTDFLLENESKNTISIDGLTEHQVAIVASIINEFRNENKE